MFKKIPSWPEVDKSTISLTTLIDEYLTTCRLEGKSPKTIRGYREKLQRFARAIDRTLEMTRRYVDQVESQVTVLKFRPSPVDRLVAMNSQRSRQRDS